eukprot:scaffold529_cov308-Pinguiococcus_pyrenoidosus.AAC.22
MQQGATRKLSRRANPLVSGDPSEAAKRALLAPRLSDRFLSIQAEQPPMKATSRPFLSAFLLAALKVQVALARSSPPTLQLRSTTANVSETPLPQSLNAYPSAGAGDPAAMSSVRKA